jgi:arylsulfatase A
VPAGRVTDEPWAFWDFLPTACDIAGAEIPKGLDGISIYPTLTGQGQQKQHEFMYWEFHEGGTKQAVRYGKWKAIRNQPRAELELYNIESDQKEANNLAAQNPDVIAKIDTYLKTARTESKEFPIVQPQPKK